MVDIVLAKGMKWWGMLFGVICFLVVILSWFNISIVSSSLISIYAVLAIIKGLTEILSRIAIEKNQGWVKKVSIILGIFDMLIGFVLLLNLADNITPLPVIFAFWIVIDSLFGLILAGSVREVNQFYYLLIMITYIISFILGFILFFNPMLSMVAFRNLIGAYILLLGCTSIGYFLVN